MQYAIFASGNELSHIQRLAIMWTKAYCQLKTQEQILVKFE